MIHGKKPAPCLEGLIDAVSVSLNQCTAEKYNALCHPKFGVEAFGAILDFTADVQKYVPHVGMSVVGVIPEEDICKMCIRDRYWINAPQLLRFWNPLLTLWVTR